jgi:hypothetical protein
VNGLSYDEARHPDLGPRLRRIALRKRSGCAAGKLTLGCDRSLPAIFSA